MRAELSRFDTATLLVLVCCHSDMLTTRSARSSQSAVRAGACARPQSAYYFYFYFAKRECRLRRAEDGLT